MRMSNWMAGVTGISILLITAAFVWYALSKPCDALDDRAAQSASEVITEDLHDSQKSVNVAAITVYIIQRDSSASDR